MRTFAKFVGPLAVVFALSLSPAPAKAQFGGFGGFGGGDMMTTMEPMLEMMKKKMGKKRFAQMMQTFGPMASQMMSSGGGGFGGMGGGFDGGFGGGMGGFGGGGFDMNSMTQMINPAMIQSMMSMGPGPRRGARKARRTF